MKRQIKFKINSILLIALIALLYQACKKETALNVQPISVISEITPGYRNGLDSLIDTLFAKYGVKVIYKIDQSDLDPTTFYSPTTIKRATLYTKSIVEKMWLEPLSQIAPRFLHDQKPIEFLIVGSGIKFNSARGADAAGAGLNAQFYRLGMAAVNSMTFDRESLREHICTLYHEHAHQMDQKYGRGYEYDRVSAGNYYGLSYGNFNTDQANRDGFFYPYGGFAPEEDFATSVETMVMYPKEKVLEFASKNPKLEKKYRLVYNFYLEKGLDLHRMHDVLDSVALLLPDDQVAD